MDEVKRSFEKVKEDMGMIHSEFYSLKKDILSLKESMISICELMNELKQDSSNRQTDRQTDNSSISTDYKEHKTINSNIKIRKDQIKGISTGNVGVQTDRQTDRQTDKKVQKEFISSQNEFESALSALDSLDQIKKEIRLKFKRLTEQELLVFSTIYQLEEEFGSSDYKSLSKRLNLSESSIRDYISRLISKNIPIEKIKINNKSIKLSISSSLRRITSLNTILGLIEI